MSDLNSSRSSSDWAPYTIHERRTMLADWLYRERAGAPYTTAQIVDVSGIYHGHGRWDKCRTDLLRLKANGVVRLVHGNPTQWESARG